MGTIGVRQLIKIRGITPVIEILSEKIIIEIVEK